MKTFITFILFAAIFIVLASQVANSQTFLNADQGTYRLTTLTDSLNDITGTDSTHYIGLNRYVSSSAEIGFTLTVDGTTGTKDAVARIYVGNDATNWAVYDATFTDTISKDSTWCYTLPSGIPYKYIGVNVDKNSITKARYVIYATLLDAKK